VSNSVHPVVVVARAGGAEVIDHEQAVLQRECQTLQRVVRRGPVAGKLQAVHCRPEVLLGEGGPLPPAGPGRPPPPQPGGTPARPRSSPKATAGSQPSPTLPCRRSPGSGTPPSPRSAQ